MDKFDCIYQRHRILSARRTPISEAQLCKRLQCSRATRYRLIDALVAHERIGLAEAARRVRVLAIGSRHAGEW